MLWSIAKFEIFENLEKIENLLGGGGFGLSKAQIKKKALNELFQATVMFCLFTKLVKTG